MKLDARKKNKIIFSGTLLIILCVVTIPYVIISCTKANTTTSKNNEWQVLEGDQNNIFDVWNNANKIKNCVKNGVIVFGSNINTIDNSFNLDSSQKSTFPVPLMQNQVIYDSIKQIIFFNNSSLTTFSPYALYNFTNLEKISLYNKATKQLEDYKLPFSFTKFNEFCFNPKSPIFQNIDKLNFNDTSLEIFSCKQGEENVFNYQQIIDLSRCKNLKLDQIKKNALLKKFPNIKLPK